MKKKTLSGLMVLAAIIAVGVFSTLRFAQAAAAQNAGAQPNMLSFGDNFIVSGDFAIGATGLGKSVNGFASGTISIGNGKDTNPGLAGTNTVPQGAQIVEGLLYWQTVEIVGGATGQNGFFRPVFNGGPATGYPITGTSLTPVNTHVYWDGTGCASAAPTSKQLVTYRTDIRGLLPQDANGDAIANGDYQVTMASQSNGTPLTLGVTLVLVYRVLSPTFPLNAVVIYNGTPASSSTITTKMVGFYDAATLPADFPLGGSPVSKLAYIAGNGRKNLSETVFLNTAGKPNNPLPSLYAGMPPLPGWYGGWDSEAWFLGPGHLPNPLHEDDSTATTVVQGGQQGCVTPAAIIYSTTVKNTDGDGHLDSWKKAMPSPGYCDAVSLDAGICHGSTDPGWVDLTGAHLGEQDLFVQLDYMCSSGDNNTCDGRYDFNPLNADPPGPGFGPLHLATKLSVDACPENVIQKVVDAFADLACQTGPRNNLHQPINLHVKLGNAVAEQTCQDNNPSNLPFCGSKLQAFPNQPGVVGWKGGFAAIKNQLVDASGHPVPCAVASPPPGCAPRFQHGKKDSWHYVLFGDQLGLPNLSFIGGTLAVGALCPAGTPCVAQTGNMVTVYTTIGHGLKVDASAGNGRVTIADGFTNPNLDGIFLVTSVTCPTNPDTHIANDCSYLNKAPGPYTFTINIGNSTSAIYTRNSDPNLSIVSGLPGTGSGFSDLGGQDSLITLANWGADANPKVIAGTFMHELGHSLGLSHGGLYYDNLAKNPLSNDYRATIEANCKANFPSVMTYHYQRTLIDNFALDYAEEWLPNPPPSLNDALDENGVPTPFFMLSNGIFNIPPYQNTFWYVPFTGIGNKAKAHCDGTPIRTGENDMTITTGPSISISWTAPQDINFDGVIQTVNTNSPNPTFGLRGHSDWTPTFAANGALLSPALDLRQIASTGNLSVTGGSANIGGGSANIGGGSANIGGGSANIGGGSANIGGGSANIGGGSANLGGGSANIGGGNGDLDRRTADAVTLPPSNATATENVSPRAITLNWNAPGFGQIVKYKVYRSDAGAPFTLIGTVTGTPPATTFQDNPACNTGGYRYEVTAVIINPDTSAEQESGPSNIASNGQHNEALTACYGPAGFNFTVPNNAVQGSIPVITWTVQDLTNTSGAPVNRAAAVSTLVVTGPLPNNCPVVGDTTILLNGNLTAQAGVSTLLAPNAGQYTLNLDTDVLCAGTYTVKLKLDSTQTTTSSLQLSIDVNDTDSTPHVATLALTAGTVGLAYSNTLNQHGGTAPFTWTFTGSFPPGISQQSLFSPTLTGTTCAAGNYNFTAMVTDSKSNSGTQPLTLQINKANTATGVISNANPSVFQQMVTFTITVAPQYSCTPTGTVTLLDGGIPIASNLALSGGMATFTTSTLAVGMHNITASYGGDSNFNGSNSATLSQTVNKANTAITISSVSPSPAVVGQSITVAYTLAVVSPGASTPIGPTGTVMVKASDSSACVAPVPGPGMCTLSPPAATAGTITFTVAYSGDNNFFGSPAANGSYTVLIFVSDGQPTPPPPFTPTTTLPNAVVGSPYSNTVYESGGVTTGQNNFSWTIVPNSVTPGGGSTLPGIGFQANAAGVTNGTFSGTPTASGTFTFTAMVTDSAGNTGTQNLTITVFPAAPAPSGLVSWYPFEGNANDLEKINNGNVVGTPQFVPGEVDNGFKPGAQLSGTLITVPDSPALALPQFTIGAWVRVDSLDNVETMQIIWKGDNTGGDLTTPYSLSVLGTANNNFSGGATVVGTAGPGKVLVILTDGTNELDLVSTKALPLDGKFHYVAATADGQKVNLYIDGMLDPNTPTSEAFLTNLPFTTANPLQIGGIQGGPAPGNNFDGVIDELQIWNRTLTPAEIFGIFNTVGESQPVPRPAGLVSWWPAEGNYTDVINGNSGTPSGGVGFAPGEVGQAFSFNGANGQIQAADNPNLDVSQITIEAWVNPRSSGQGRPILQKRSSSNVGGYTLEMTNSPAGPANGLQFVIWIGGLQQILQTPANALTLNEWQHVAATFDGSTMAIYVNGVQQASLAVSGSIDPDSTDPLVMGLNVVDGSDWDGFTDEVSLYNRALTSTQIQAIVNAGGAGKAKP